MSFLGLKIKNRINQAIQELRLINAFSYNSNYNCNTLIKDYFQLNLNNITSVNLKKILTEGIKLFFETIHS